MTTTQPAPPVALHDGTTIPQLGFGTLNVPPGRDSSPERMAQTGEIVGTAIDLGYRLLDTAQQYGNEQGVGQAIAATDIPRDELYVTTKLGNANHHPDDVRRSFDKSLTNLGLDQLDLFLIHWPLPTVDGIDYVTTWKAITDLVADGWLRSAGVSNFQPAHLDRIISETGVVPVVNQIEVHPYFANRAACDATTRYGIVVEAWSPLGQGQVLDDPTIGAIAAATGKTPAQVILRWHVQHGHVVVPKSVHTERMRDNRQLFDFELTDDQMAAIDALDRGPDARIGPNPDTFDWIPSDTAPNPTRN
jgi:2,5-diketo-D-gluconate reductase A